VALTKVISISALVVILFSDLSSDSPAYCHLQH